MNKMDKSGNNRAGGHLAATYARKETYLPLRFFTTLLVMMLTAVCVMGQGIGGQAPNLSVSLKSGLDNVPGSVINTVEDATIWHGSITDVSSVPNGHFYSTADNPTQYWFKAANNTFTAPEGYLFIGWKYGNATYQPGQSIQMTSNSITLTAQWELIPPYALLQPGTAGYSPVEENTVIINNSNFYSSISDDGDGVANGQFYTDSDNRIWFKAVGNPFTTPEGYRFAGWTDGYATYQPGQPIQMPSSGSITLTAQWVDKDAPHYLLSPTRYTLEGSGYTDIPCILTEYANGIINGQEPINVGFYMNGGTLTDGKGHSISFLVDDKIHFGAAERKYQGAAHNTLSETFIMAIYISPEAFNQAVPGTYTGTFTYDSEWKPMNYTGDSGSMILTLVVPESPDKIDLEAHAATLNGVSRYWTTFYHGKSAYQLPAGAQAFYMKEDKSLYLLGTDGSVIPAMTPVIIMSEAASISLQKMTTAPSITVSGNILQGTDADKNVSHYYNSMERNAYVLSKVGDAFGFFKFSGTIPANKAYFISK